MVAAHANVPRDRTGEPNIGMFGHRSIREDRWHF
jgi:hypothetical protein